MSSGRPVIICTVLDRDTDTIKFIRSDRKEAEVRAPVGSFPPDSHLSRLLWSMPLNGLIATTTAGDEIAWQLHDPGDDQRRGRPAIYLDQNQWSLLSRAAHRRGPPPTIAELDACNRLIDLAQTSKVILPLSAGHHVESTKWGDDQRRYDLALTELQLSHGWQLRHPQDVRGAELFALLRARTPNETVPRSDVITLEPSASARAETVSWAPVPDLPAEYNRALRTLLAARVTIEVMLDDKHIPPPDQPPWAAIQQKFSDELDASPASKHEKQRLVDAWLFEDFRDEISTAESECGITPDAFSRWITDRPWSGARLSAPALLLYRHMLHARHLSRGSKWKHNDLTDLTYLACAGAYAQIVVGEAHMSTLLRNAVRTSALDTRVFTNLPEAIECIEAVTVPLSIHDEHSD